MYSENINYAIFFIIINNTDNDRILIRTDKSIDLGNTYFVLWSSLYLAITEDVTIFLMLKQLLIKYIGTDNAYINFKFVLFQNFIFA